MPTLGAKLGHLQRRFLRDRRGGFAVLLALALIPMLAAVGLAIDSARGYMVKSKLSYAVDAAGLAAAQSTDDTDVMAADIQKYFDANFPPGFMGANVQGPDYNLSSNNNVITLEARATIDTTFMRLLGFEDLEVSASAEVTRSIPILDLVFSFDISGSMGWSAGSGGSRIEAARAAANKMIEILWGDEPTLATLQVGLVPWSDKVRITEPNSTFLSVTTSSSSTFTNPLSGASQNEVYYANNAPSVPLLFQPPNNWKGCVLARYIDGEPEANQGHTQYGPDRFGSLDWFGWEPPSTGHGSLGGSGGSSKKKKKSSGGSGGGSDNLSCPGPGITPLQSVKQYMIDRIEELEPEAGTNMAQGLVWAWRVLMAGEPFDEAEVAPDPVPERVIVLLTDGQQTVQSTNAYLGELSANEMDDAAEAIAAQIKAQNIRIIAVQFANSGTDLETLMRSIGTEYHYAPNGDSLEDIFEEIGNELAEIHLSK